MKKKGVLLFIVSIMAFSIMMCSCGGGDDWIPAIPNPWAPDDSEPPPPPPLPPTSSDWMIETVDTMNVMYIILGRLKSLIMTCRINIVCN